MRHTLPALCKVIVSKMLIKKLKTSTLKQKMQNLKHKKRGRSV